MPATPAASSRPPNPPPVTPRSSTPWASRPRPGSSTSPRLKRLPRGPATRHYTCQRHRRPDLAVTPLSACSHGRFVCLATNINCRTPVWEEGAGGVAVVEVAGCPPCRLAVAVGLATRTPAGLTLPDQRRRRQANQVTRR